MSTSNKLRFVTDTFGLPETEGRWDLVITLAGEDFGLKIGVPWNVLSLHLSRNVFPSHADHDSTTFVSTPSGDLHGLLRQWIRLSNSAAAGGLPLIYQGRLEILWIRDTTQETPSDAVDPNIDISFLVSATDSSVVYSETLRTIPSLLFLFFTTGFPVYIIAGHQLEWKTIVQSLETLSD